MHLRDYLESKPRGAAAQLARDLSTPHSTITGLTKDQFWPSRELWQRILGATDGQVTPNDHLNPVR
jgi:hypothetical protein